MEEGYGGKEIGKRSYVVRTEDGGTYRRRQLRLTKEVMKESQTLDNDVNQLR